MFSNLATSLDGKIAPTDRKMFAIGSAKDLRLLRTLRDGADAIIYGAEVLRTFQKPCLPQDKEHRLVNAVLSHRLDGIDPDWPFFKSKKIDRLLFVTGRVPTTRRKIFEKVADVISIESKQVARGILAELRARGLSRVGVEGGGQLMWEFARENLIEEYYVTLVPRIIGGRDAPTLVDGEGFSAERTLNLRLKRTRKVGSELFLVYEPVGRGRRHPLFN